MSRAQSSSSIPSSQTPPVADAKNPLSVRLYKILGTQYDDPSTREALEILSALYASNNSSSARSILSKTEKKDLRINGPGTRPDATLSEESDEEETTQPQANKTIERRSEDFINAASQARRHLRKDMERKLTQTSRRFLEAFSEVNQVGMFISHMAQGTK
jgi:conserved oligomeric Golgi complex subunit 6